jgi:protocatechuate 3,4-dioxygenase beta subunit
MTSDGKKTEGLWLPRRMVIQGVGAAMALAPLSQVLACGKGPDEEGRGDGNWATGGTAAMSGTYPDPFTAGLGSACTLYKASTKGPCHALTAERKDISEAQPGLPVRLAFLIVNPSCEPVPGATLELWHTNPGGLYSGSDAINMCTNGNAAARASRWFRGIQTADAKGRVDFDTCFPGWYGGRTIHIHFTVRVGGTEYLTSQLYFDDKLNDEILETQPVYKGRGAKDTTNASDGVLRQTGPSGFLFETKKMDDGALLAWKAIVVHA